MINFCFAHFIRQSVMIFFLLTSLFFAKIVLAEEGGLTLPSAEFEGMKLTGRAIVVEIINPLTVKLDDDRVIQLVGLDFPDLDFYEPGDFSLTAIEILKDLLVKRQVEIYQTADKEKGRKNRIGQDIAHLRRSDDGVWAQGTLLIFGLSRVRTTSENKDMAKEMLALEKDARDANRGIWGIEEYKILSPEQASNYIGRYHIVEGKVMSVTPRTERTYLNFGQDWREDFTVSFSAQDLKKFSHERIYPQQWNGKTIRARGWIESYNGPHIKIDHYQSVEMIEGEKPEPPAEPEKKETSILQQGSALPGYNP
ncbi:MAG: hypothetical protein GC137_05000 [Alphaproteobacteria bacterium]|nr:hypothetical protein [Alphaproteobacteria bacterium]